jgi:hypothetical protein
MNDDDAEKAEVIEEGETMVVLTETGARLSRLLRAEERMVSRGYSLGMVAGRMLRLLMDEAECFEDMHLFHAPSECGVIIHAGAELNRALVLADAGLTAEEYNGLLALRCDGKQVYQLGLTVDGPEG